LKKSDLFMYNSHTASTLMHKQKGPSARLSSGWRSGGISGIWEEELLEGLGERPGGIGS
jgi:hypothetical protein